VNAVVWRILELQLETLFPLEKIIWNVKQDVLLRGTSAAS
jgi:hypothetical protein